MAAPGRDRIFIAANLGALFARVVLFALAVMIAAGGAPGTAQTTAPPKRIGFLASVFCPARDGPPLGMMFISRLAELGWIEGRTAVIDCVNAAGRLDQFGPLAVELVARRPDVLFGASTPAIRALKQATVTIPIVTIASDPVRSGLLSDLAHPEANVTGLAPMSFELLPKRIELLKETCSHDSPNWRYFIAKAAILPISSKCKTRPLLRQKRSASHGKSFTRPYRRTTT